MRPVLPHHFTLLFVVVVVQCFELSSSAGRGFPFEEEAFNFTNGQFPFDGEAFDPSKAAGKFVMNQIDQCWRMNPGWADDRQALSDCAVGFGKEAIGGKNGNIYVVNDTSDDAADPKPGTLRWGAIQEEPLWIIFEKDASLKLENELIVNSHKTIDGRGFKVEIANGPCVTLQDVTNIIIHGVHFHHCTAGKYGMVASSTTHVGRRRGSDGDGVSLFNASHVWIDHCSFSQCDDGLVDAVCASTAVTVSNCHFSTHDKVMLFGHSDDFEEDKKMKVTLVYNHFAPGLVQRMPRVRFGYVHVANNLYEEWEMYAIGGSANPTILSQGNYFFALDDPARKEVTKRETDGWKSWKWESSEDFFQNDAFFVPSGHGSAAPDYSGNEDFMVMHGSMVPLLTASAGALECEEGYPCINF